MILKLIISILFILYCQGIYATDPTNGYSCGEFRITIPDRVDLTIVFSQNHTCGTYVNGDTWVLLNSTNMLTISQMEPYFDGNRNGFEINPTSPTQHGFDSRVEGFNASLVPELPLVIRSPCSLVKAVSVVGADECTTETGCLKFASVLTVVDKIPSIKDFRPAYFGKVKKQYSATNLQTQKLPSLKPTNVSMTIENIAQRFRQVQLDHLSSSEQRKIHPQLNIRLFGGLIVSDVGDAVLRLYLNDTIKEKEELLINFIQAGIDYYGMMSGGVTWPADRGHMAGRILPILFASLMLDDLEMGKKAGNKPLNTFQETGQVYKSANTSLVLWGRECESGVYWTDLHNNNTKSDCRDPYGYIDGGFPGGELNDQKSTTSQNWKSTALSMLLIPELKCMFNYEPFFEYVDRWVKTGYCTLPDPYTMSGAPGSPSRFKDVNGTFANTGDELYYTDFSETMWEAYRSTAPVKVCPPRSVTTSSDSMEEGLVSSSTILHPLSFISAILFVFSVILTLV